VWLDTVRIYWWASFWKWMEPAWTTKIWMLLFVLGLVGASFGLAGLLTTASVPPALSGVVRYATLQFVGRSVRNWTLVFGGIAVIVVSLVYLNRHLMNAFAGHDPGDLAGIARARRRGEVGSTEER
jgi:hypothetical protein